MIFFVIILIALGYYTFFQASPISAEFPNLVIVATLLYIFLRDRASLQQWLLILITIFVISGAELRTPISVGAIVLTSVAVGLLLRMYFLRTAPFSTCFIVLISIDTLWLIIYGAPTVSLWLHYCAVDALIIALAKSISQFTKTVSHANASSFSL